MQTIQATSQTIEELFSRAQEFAIPEFQRPYSWEEEECDTLWDDLVSFYGSPDKSEETYYLGNIVLYREKENDKTWLVIDGQQRMTTLFMLIKAVSLKAATKKILQPMIFKTTPLEDEVTKEVRMESRVLPGGGKDDSGDFKKIMLGDDKELSDKNQFKININRLKAHLEDWLKGKTPEEFNNFILFLLKRVVVLPIKCESQGDALTLFQTINDRGMPLSPADIFKAKIYQAIPSHEDKSKFIEAWKSLDNHVELFRTYMHILRANNNDTSRERNIKDYIIKECLDKGDLPKKWELVMNALKKIHYVAQNNVPINKGTFAEADMYWSMLCYCPHKYWQYPLLVFLHKHLVAQKDRKWVLPDDKTEEYLVLAKTTIRYYFIKALVHNSVNAVKDTTYKVCVKIANGENYIAEYRNCINSKNDMAELELKMNSSNYRKCLDGLAVINSSLNRNQGHAAYNESLEGNIDIEHILPHQWSNYGKWTDESHKLDLNKIGNLIPLERKINIAAKNKPFSRKQDEYEKSKIQDALDLSDKDKQKHWYPEDLEQRDKESREKLLSFFKDIMKDS